MNRFRRHFVNHYPLIKEPYSNTLYIIVTIAFMFLAGCSSRQETTMTKAPQFDRGKFEALYRAGKAVDASIAVSVTREKFRELVQAFATETSIARDKATVSDEKGLVESFSDALAAYHDSLQLWDAQIKQQLEFSQKNAILCFGEISPIAARNGLPCIESNTAGITVIPNESIQFLWIVTGVRLRKASALFLADQSLQANQDLDQIKKAFYRPLLEEIQANRDERDRRLAREAADRRQREAKAAKDLEIRNKLIKQAEQFYRQGFDYAGPETTVFHPDRADAALKSEGRWGWGPRQRDRSMRNGDGREAESG